MLYVWAPIGKIGFSCCTVRKQVCFRRLLIVSLRLQEGVVVASYTLRDAPDMSNFTRNISLAVLSIRIVTDQPLLERSLPISKVQQRTRLFRDQSTGVVLRSNLSWSYCASRQRDRATDLLFDSRICYTSYAKRRRIQRYGQTSRERYSLPATKFRWQSCTFPFEANRLEI
jgi:hypothetical protein